LEEKFPVTAYRCPMSEATVNEVVTPGAIATVEVSVVTDGTTSKLISAHNTRKFRYKLALHKEVKPKGIAVEAFIVFNVNPVNFPVFKG